ncbi:MAG TPA: 4-hydroxy-3-methylbut-2-en-1-yl diphosphate synthase [Bacteroidales bacterium]|nr:4-hydroxy-3-methylbut-2-en-1-yl diphosphate synthase [Bacteroidales bacterium]
MKYENYISLFQYNRLKTRSVRVGKIEMGGNNPIRIQSMTSTNTLNTEDTILQSLRIIKAGGELVRITTQGEREAENLENIKKGIRKEGFDTAIAADIHFNPKAAFVAAGLVEKVRINPGNFVDKRASFKKVEFTDEEYHNELIRIEEKVVPLIKICEQNKTALRIGVNHGSLSDRIMSRYGDTPKGMVESAMEFLRICVRENFLDVVVSLKSSNTRVMVHSNRLMIAKMIDEDMNFPLHLGVTEAGEGEDGRIKSSVGIGALLADGIGDTIRVSLTEPPEDEIPVAKKLVEYFKERDTHKKINGLNSIPVNFYEYSKRKTHSVLNVGGDFVPVVIGNAASINELKPEFVYLGNDIAISTPNGYSNYIIDEEVWEQQIFHYENVFPLYSSFNNFYLSDHQSPTLNFLTINAADLHDENLLKIKNHKNLILILVTTNQNGFADQRAAFLSLVNAKVDIPVIIKRSYKENELENLQIKSASDLGGLFLDGFGDGIWIDNNGKIDEQDLINISFGILQASRVRTSKTEYISCPGCGRTLFDLQKTTKEIREKTSHLKNLKIGIMGCIVNGPGEMADADYGYVGAGPGKITLYKNKEVVKKNIQEEKAVEELIKLIKENGDWIDK